MSCVSPLTAYHSKEGSRPNGKARFVFSPQLALHGAEPVLLPCGQCIGCRLERSRQWALRCVHEAKSWEKNCFITLTYDEDHLPENKSLVKNDLQLFFKRLRKKYGEGIRFFACGEYGDDNERPHYHCAIFNWRPADLDFYDNNYGNPLYTSRSLSTIWTAGFVTVGELTFESSAYVARYCLKKINGAKAEEHYHGREPEFVNMSRRPGIGKDYFDQYKKDIYAIDGVIVRNGLKMHPPKYYDLQYESIQPEHMEVIKCKRKQKLNPVEQQEYRLKTKERLMLARTKKFKRNVENA